MYTINSEAKVTAQDPKNRRKDWTMQPKAIITLKYHKENFNKLC